MYHACPHLVWVFFLFRFWFLGGFGVGSLMDQTFMLTADERFGARGKVLLHVLVTDQISRFCLTFCMPEGKLLSRKQALV